jgi:hypothetical protein
MPNRAYKPDVALIARLGLNTSMEAKMFGPKYTLPYRANIKSPKIHENCGIIIIHENNIIKG